ncbi:Uncharacterised protein [uncultured Actinomyces sp.]|nr:Uncharacterised protein [uncultured Actinomyces sp.]
MRGARGAEALRAPRCVLWLCPGGACGPTGVPGATRAVLWGRAAWCARGRRPARLLVLLVAPRVFRAPEGPAAREARRPHCVRRRASKPARALRSLRRPPHQWGRVADVQSCASCRSPARPRLRPRPPPPGPVGRLGRLSETGGTCARVYLRRIETAIAFAGEERAFVVHFSGAEVIPVSLVPCWGRAEVLLVSTLPCFCVLCAKFFAPISPAPVLDAARRSPHC